MTKMRSFWKVLLGFVAGVFATSATADAKNVVTQQPSYGTTKTDATVRHQPDSKKVVMPGYGVAQLGTPSDHGFALILTPQQATSQTENGSISMQKNNNDNADSLEVTVTLPALGKVPVVTTKEAESSYAGKTVIIMNNDFTSGYLRVPLTTEGEQETLLREYLKVKE